MAFKKMTKGAYVYQAYDLKKNLICEGTLDFVSDILGADPRTVYMDSVHGAKLFGLYKIKRKENSIVGNSHRTMIKDIEINGVDAVIQKSISTLNNFARKISMYNEIENKADLMDSLVDAYVSLDEMKVLLNLNDGMCMTNYGLSESKREKLKELAREIEGTVCD